MSYRRTTVIARRGYSSPMPVGGVFEDIKSGVKGAVSSALSFYGQSQQAAGAAAALQAQNQQMAEQLANRSSPGINTTTLAIGGAAVLGLVLLLRKK